MIAHLEKRLHTNPVSTSTPLYSITLILPSRLQVLSSIFTRKQRNPLAKETLISTQLLWLSPCRGPSKKGFDMEGTCVLSIESCYFPSAAHTSFIKMNVVSEKEIFLT